MTGLSRYVHCNQKWRDRWFRCLVVQPGTRLVSGHDLSRAANAAKISGFSPCGMMQFNYFPPTPLPKMNAENPPRKRGMGLSPSLFP
jgi:hypothetical protein